MARIKIVDLPCDIKISKEEMKKVFGGFGAEQTSGIITNGAEQVLLDKVQYLKIWSGSTDSLIGPTGTSYLKF